MQRRSLRRRLAAGGSLLIASVVAALVAGAGSAVRSSERSVGIARAGGTGLVQQAQRNAQSRVASFGPNVGEGVFDGESPAVSDLPVLPVAPVTQIVPRENESLKPATQPFQVNDPVVQTKRGTGPLSAPVRNFDGVCLPFGDTPCHEASSCSCLPPDTNGEVGLNQYVQMVNTDFAVYSKTGAV